MARVRRIDITDEEEAPVKKPRKRREPKIVIPVDLKTSCEYDEELQCFKIESPLFIQVTSNKKFPMNMNHYRNAHWSTLGDAKKIYTSIMRDAICTLPHMNKISVNYMLTFTSEMKRKHDGMNVCSVTSKFFLDALVEYHIIPDDNIDYVIHEEWNATPLEKVGKVVIQIYPVA